MNTRRRVRVAKGFCGNAQNTNATMNLLMKANGVYINPSLLETGYKSDKSPCKSPSYLTFMILYDIKTMNPEESSTTITPRQISMTVASEKLKENRSKGNINKLNMSVKFLYFILKTTLISNYGYL